jgi:hypothetical protein
MKQLYIKRPEFNTPEAFEMPDGQSDCETDMDSSNPSEVVQTPRSSMESLSGGFTTPTSSVSSCVNFWHDHQCCHFYTNMEAKDKAIQLNGDLGSSGTFSKTCCNHYYRNIASGHSVQVNGNISNPALVATLLAR